MSWWKKLERPRCQTELRVATLKTSVMEVRLAFFGLKKTDVIVSSACPFGFETGVWERTFLGGILIVAAGTSQDS